QASGTLSVTAEQIELLDSQMHELLSSAQQQSSATQQIHTLMSQVHESIEGVAEMSNASALVSEQVNRQVSELNQEMGQFKVQ
ncbi:hypothetical protein AKJ18_22850, partial [Vibrio xuii]